jgi:tetratricopeptide (TPR) repeat protein
MHRVRAFAAVLGLLFVANVCRGQSIILDLPRDSQHAVVTQRVGVTDITINYHRPLVKGRKIWGGVVSYGDVWRAGANENTTIAFSDPVTIEGKPLDKGIYGLHMIPAEDQWTVIFSKNSTSWGSFTYNPAEDALRVTAKPAATDLRDALTYDFDQLQPDSAVVTLRWEKIAVPFKVAVNVNDVVEQSLHKQLRGLGQYTWDGWNDAADYLVSHKMNLNEALRYTDESLKVEERYENLTTKSQALDALGKKDEAAKLRKLAMEKAGPFDLYGYGRQLQGEGKQDEAFAIYRTDANKYPDHWIVHAGLARVYSAKGDFDNALKEMKLAQAVAPDNAHSFVESQMRKLAAKEDINK